MNKEKKSQAKEKCIADICYEIRDGETPAARGAIEIAGLIPGFKKQAVLDFIEECKKEKGFVEDAYVEDVLESSYQKLYPSK